ncbi:MAG: hypothetical protein ACYTA5_25850, partial [Planctomycetota bacterium]
MKTTRILLIPALALLFVASTAKVSEAASVGTAFTYQGLLYDANNAANGLYDFQFKVFDDANVVDGNQVGGDVNVSDVDVIDGYFTVELDFGSSVFDGDARWLEIGVRPGDQNDPNVYLALEPLQEMTPTPYAIHAGSDNDWMVKGNVMYSIPDGNVAIGATNPLNNKLYVVSPLGEYGFGRSTIYGRRSGPNVAANGGTAWSLNGVDAAVKGYSLPGNNYTAGVAGYNFMDHAQSAGVIGARKNGTVRGMLGYNDADSKLWAGYFVGDGYFSGNVGIGTTDPNEKLDVLGTVKATAFTGDGSGLTNLPVVGYTAGTMLDLVGNEFSHADTSSAGSINNSGGNVIQDMTFDLAGHVTGGGSYNLDLRYYTETELQTSGSGASVHWDNLNAVPPGFSDGTDDIGGPDSDWIISDNNMYPGAGVTGNVGIGTTSPAAKLTVNGGILRRSSTMYGSNANTHINLGMSSTTGTNGQNYSYATVSGGSYNNASGPRATIGGGYDNTASADLATVGGGLSNDANGDGATISGGWFNTASPLATVSGGSYNDANGQNGTVGGGQYNTASGHAATVSGGEDNTASNWYATVCGGSDNTASGTNSFAAGYRAKAIHAGAFVWGDYSFADVNSTIINQWTARASGGVYFYTNSSLTSGVYVS